MSQGRSVRGARAVVIVALVLFAFWRPLFAGGTLAPDDQLWFSDPFNAAPPQELTIETAERDAGTIHAYWLGWAEDVRNGDLSWWRDAGSGQPFFAEGLPVTHLVYLAVPGWYAPGLIAALSVLLAAVGAMWLADRNGFAPLAGLFAGVVFGFSGLLFAWIGWPHATAIALAPWVVLGLLRVSDEPTPRRVLAASAVLAAQLWCGVFALAVFTVAGALGWVTVEWSRQQRGRIVAATLATVLGGLLATPHLWPRWERWSWADTEHLEAIADTSAPFVAIVTTIFGGALGNPAVGVGWFEVGSFQLSVGFVGTSAGVAAIAAVVGRRAPLGAGLLVGLGVAFAYVGGPFAAVASFVIGDASLASHARVLVVLGLAVGAAAGVDLVLDGRITVDGLRSLAWVGRARAVSAVVAATALVVAAVWLNTVRNSQVLTVIAAQAIGPLLVLGLLGFSFGLWARRRITGPTLVVVLLALAGYELLSFGMPIPTVTDRSERAEPGAAHAALAEVLDGAGRVAGDHDAFSPAAAPRFSIADVRSPDLRSPGEVAAFRQVDAASVLGALGGGPFEPIVRVDDDPSLFRHPVWDLLGVDAWVLPRDATPPGPRIDPVPDTRTAAAAASPLGSVLVPEHGLRAVVLDLDIPAFSTIAIEVDDGDVQVSTTVVLRSPRDGFTAVPIAGEGLTPGREARVVLAIDPVDRPAAVGTVDGAIVMGTVGGEADSSLVWADGAVIVARPTPRVVWGGVDAGELVIAETAADRLRVDVVADAAGVVRSDIVAEPGWAVRVDGEVVEAVLVEDLVLGAEVGPGAHVVEFIYRPPRFGGGLALAALGLVVWLAWAIRLRW